MKFILSNIRSAFFEETEESRGTRPIKIELCVEGITKFFPNLCGRNAIKVIASKRKLKGKTAKRVEFFWIKDKKLEMLHPRLSINGKATNLLSTTAWVVEKFLEIPNQSKGKHTFWINVLPTKALTF